MKIEKRQRVHFRHNTTDATASSAAECLLQHFGRFGAPHQLRSDNGFDDHERSDIGVNIPLSRLSMLPNSI